MRKDSGDARRCVRCVTTLRPSRDGLARRGWLRPPGLAPVEQLPYDINLLVEIIYIVAYLETGRKRSPCRRALCGLCPPFIA